MSDLLAVIDRVMEEHEHIKRDINLVRDSTNDLGVVSGLQQTRADWVHSTLDNLSTKRQQIQLEFSQADQGLKSHFSYEETALPPIFGDTLMKVLLIEHKEIIQQFEIAKTMVDETNLEEMNQQDLLSFKARLQQIISKLSNDIEHHAIIEDHILRWLKKNL